MPLGSASIPTLRLFSTSAPIAAKAQPTLKLNHLLSSSPIPQYPYGPSHWYKQSNSGLYGATRIQFGNKVSSRNEIKTRRKWHPNIRSKRLWSESLERFVRLKVHSRVLRTIDKVGGLDEYVLGDKAGRVKELGVGGWGLRWRIMRTGKVRERFAEERRAMGLPVDDGWEADEKGLNGEVVGKDEARREEREFDQMLDEEERRAVREGDDVDEVLGGGFVEKAEVRDQPRVVL